jgi:hypothetical protein
MRQGDQVTSYGRFPDRMTSKPAIVQDDSEEIADLLVSQITPELFGSVSGLSHNDAVKEAFKRGYDSGYSERSRETFG